MRQINFEGGPGAVKASFSASMALRSDFITLDMAPTAGKAFLLLGRFLPLLVLACVARIFIYCTVFLYTGL